MLQGGNHYPDVQMLAVSHVGVRLARQESSHLRVIHTIGYVYKCNKSFCTLDVHDLDVSVVFKHLKIYCIMFRLQNSGSDHLQNVSILNNVCRPCVFCSWSIKFKLLNSLLSSVNFYIQNFTTWNNYYKIKIIVICDKTLQFFY